MRQTVLNNTYDFFFTNGSKFIIIGRCLAKLARKRIRKARIMNMLEHVSENTSSSYLNHC